MLSTAATPSAPHLLDPERASLHSGPVYRAALRLTRSPHDAEDLAQEAYARVLARPRIVRGDDDLGYLLRAVRNTHFSAHRSAQRRACVAMEPADLDRMPRRGGDPHTAAEARELLAGIAALPEPQRAVVTAVDVVGLTYAEAAEALGIPVGTVMSRLFRARGALSR